MGFKDCKPGCDCWACQSAGRIALPLKMKRQHDIRKMSAEPMKAKAAQKPCDIGLFSDEADQLDLVEMLQDPVD